MLTSEEVFQNRKPQGDGVCIRCMASLLHNLTEFCSCVSYAYEWPIATLNQATFFLNSLMSLY